MTYQTVRRGMLVAQRRHILQAIERTMREAEDPLTTCGLGAWSCRQLHRVCTSESKESVGDWLRDGALERLKTLRGLL